MYVIEHYKHYTIQPAMMWSKFLLHTSSYALLCALLVVDASTFSALKSHANLDTCAINGPSIVTYARSQVDCIRLCASQTGQSCFGVNYIGMTKKCEMYSYQVENFAPAPDCKHFRLKNGTSEVDTRCVADVTYPHTAPENCSLPFTYNGGLYYGCMQNVTAGWSDECKLLSFCLIADRVVAVCDQPTGFSVGSVIVPVSFPNYSGRTITLPMRSVNRWITIHSRIDDQFPTDLMWTQYVDGFGNSTDGGNFWLGLEYLSMITVKAYRLRVELNAAANGRWFSEEYAKFRVDSPNQMYALRLSRVGYGDAGDGFNGDPNFTQNGMQFSAQDQRNDLSVSNCAKQFGGGWWYNKCMISNLNGLIPVWSPLIAVGASPSATLKECRMMITAV